MIFTSLNEIKSFNPCIAGWKDILTGQRKIIPDDVLFPLTDAVESNSISDVCWLLGKRKIEIQVAMQFARMCADSVAYTENSHATNATAYADAYATNADAYATNATNAAAYAINAAAYAAAYAATYAAAYAAKQKQQELNKQFLIQCITEYSPKKEFRTEHLNKR